MTDHWRHAGQQSKSCRSLSGYNAIPHDLQPLLGFLVVLGHEPTIKAGLASRIPWLGHQHVHRWGVLTDSKKSQILFKISLQKESQVLFETENVLEHFRHQAGLEGHEENASPFSLRVEEEF